MGGRGGRISIAGYHARERHNPSLSWEFEGPANVSKRGVAGLWQCEHSSGSEGGPAFAEFRRGSHSLSSCVRVCGSFAAELRSSAEAAGLTVDHGERAACTPFPGIQRLVSHRTIVVKGKGVIIPWFCFVKQPRGTGGHKTDEWLPTLHKRNHKPLMHRGEEVTAVPFTSFCTKSLNS